MHETMSWSSHSIFFNICSYKPPLLSLRTLANTDWATHWLSLLDTALFYCKLHSRDVWQESKNLDALQRVCGDCLAPCRHQLYWRKAEQQKINSNKQNCLFMQPPNYESQAFCILHVQEHDVNTAVLQQEAKDKTWRTISFLSTNLSLWFCLCFTKYRLALQIILEMLFFF